MFIESPTRYVIPPAYARGLPTAPAPAPLRASSAAASRPLRARAASSLHALHYASGVRGYAAHLDTPPRASKVAPRGQRLRARRVSRPLRTTARAPCARYARRSLRSEVAAAQLRPTVVLRLRSGQAVEGDANVVDDFPRRVRAARASRASARPSPEAERLEDSAHASGPPQRRITLA